MLGRAKEIGISGSIVMIISFLNGLVLLPWYISIFSKEDYALWLAIQASLSWLFAADLGISEALQANFSVKGVKNNNGSVIIILFFFALFYILLLPILFYFSNNNFFILISIATQVFGVLAINSLIAYFNYSHNIFSASNKFIWANQLGGLTLQIVLIVFLDPNIIFFTAPYALAQIIAFIILLYRFIKMVSIEGYELRGCLENLISRTKISIIPRITEKSVGGLLPLFINNLGSPDLTIYYVVGRRLSRFGFQCSSIVRSSILPKVYEKLNKFSLESIKKEIQSYNYLVISVSPFLILTIDIYLHEILNLEINKVLITMFVFYYILISINSFYEAFSIKNFDIFSILTLSLIPFIMMIIEIIIVLNFKVDWPIMIFSTAGMAISFLIYSFKKNISIDYKRNISFLLIIILYVVLVDYYIIKSSLILIYGLFNFSKIYKNFKSFYVQ